MSDLPLRDYAFLGTTQSLCPTCLRVVPAKVVARGGRVYFRKRCPEHGEREDFVCSDRSWYDQSQYNVPGKIPAVMAAEPSGGCPLDCGLCPDHEQHTCVGLVEITSSCNLTCPMCYASSGPGGAHLSLDECKRAIDRLVQVEGGAEVLQLSGGEPTIHPEFEQILAYAMESDIEVVMINTNGVRLATDPALIELLARYPRRLELYFQFDGFREATADALRGARLVELKLRALDALAAAGIRVTLVATLQPGVNDDEIGALVRFAAGRPHVAGLSLQPATYTGRHVAPEELERRLTFPDVVKAIAAQTDGMFRESDFIPLPCAHPNCHILTYAFRKGGQVYPLTRMFDPATHIDLLANGISYNRARARQLVEGYLSEACAATGCDSPEVFLASMAARGGSEVELDFFTRARSERLDPADVFRITITSFLDAYNFDVRRVMKCCIHHVLPSGHVVPFCAYNVLYRDGHVPLARLVDGGVVAAPGPAGAPGAAAPSPGGEGASKLVRLSLLRSGDGG
jgi:7,8-dihydro-6-hydroxymethylpterin dimethyltransferase